MTIRHTFKEGIELNEQERQNVTRRVGAQDKSARPFAQVLDAFAAEPENNLFGVTNAFTRAAQGYNGEKSYEMQLLGYRVLT